MDTTDAGGGIGVEGDVEAGSRRFIAEIAAEHERGAQFVPLTGAGISADSGVICGDELLRYLQYAAYRYSQGWNIQDDGWPPVPQVQDPLAAEWWAGLAGQSHRTAYAEALLAGSRD